MFPIPRRIHLNSELTQNGQKNIQYFPIQYYPHTETVYPQVFPCVFPSTPHPQVAGPLSTAYWAPADGQIEPRHTGRASSWEIPMGFNFCREKHVF